MYASVRQQITRWIFIDNLSNKRSYKGRLKSIFFRIGLCPATDNVACVAGSIVWVRDWSFGGGAVFQKKGGRDEAAEISRISRVFASRDGSAVKSYSTILQQLRRQISLDYYTIPPATQATDNDPT